MERAGGRWGLLRVMCELHSLGCLPVAHSVTDLGLVLVTKMKRLCSSLDLLPGLLETQVIHSGVFCKCDPHGFAGHGVCTRVFLRS